MRFYVHYNTVVIILEYTKVPLFKVKFKFTYIDYSFTVKIKLTHQI
jgi:hypothetical protein